MELNLSEDPSNNIIEKILKNSEILNTKIDLQQSMKESKDFSGLYVFVSFDIVNSTLYKSIDRDWYKLIDYFYDTLPAYFKSEEIGEKFKIWKFIGDEVLFYSRINNSRDLIKIPSEITSTIRKVTKAMHNKFNESCGLLSIKATAWSAIVSDKSGSDDNDERYKHKNVLFKRIRGGNKEFPITIYDFIGPEIDLGFRLAKSNAKKNQVLLSAELTYMILDIINSLDDDPEIGEDFKISEKAKYKIMCIEELKGIWHRRKYPIIWYREQWETDIFDYDEDDLEKYTFYNDKQNKKEVRVYLKEVLSSVGRFQSVRNAIDDIEKGASKNLDSIVNGLSNQAEIHLVSILFDEMDNVLLLKRGKSKKNNDFYDFGCADLLNKKSFSDSLTKYYSKLLETQQSLSFVKDSFGNLIPIGTYVFEKSSGTLASGIIFCAKVQNIDVNTKELSRKGYQEFKKIPYTDLSSEYLQEKQITLFDGSLENIQKAHSLLTGDLVLKKTFK